MAQGLPDLTRIRRNWERAEADPSGRDPGPDRLGHVRAPLDPFVARVEQRFERMRARASSPAGAPATEPPAALPLREQFVAALNDLEDLCEALLHVKR